MEGKVPSTMLLLCVFGFLEEGVSQLSVTLVGIVDGHGVVDVVFRVVFLKLFLELFQPSEHLLHGVVDAELIGTRFFFEFFELRFVLLHRWGESFLVCCDELVEGGGEVFLEGEQEGFTAGGIGRGSVVVGVFP